MATRRDDPFADMPWLSKGTSPGRDRWDDNSLLVQTIDEMKAAMGADNAYSVVVGVGNAIAAAAARTGSQINPHDTTLLAQVLASLTPADRKAIAAGDNGAVRGKVDALIDHQAQMNMQARLTANLHGPAQTGTDAASAKAESARNAKQPAQLTQPTAERGPQGTAGRTDYTGLPGSTAWGNPAFLQAVGLSLPTAGTLAAMGHTSQAQIKAIVNDTRTLGIDRVDKDKSAIALGGLKAYDRDNYRGHIQFFNGAYAKSYDHVLDLEGRFKSETDPAKRATLQKELDTARKTHADLVARQRGKIKDERALPHFDATEDMKRRAIEEARRRGLEAAQKADVHTLGSVSPANRPQQAEAYKAVNEATSTRADKALKGKIGLLDEEASGPDPSPSKHAAVPPQPAQPSPAAQPAPATAPASNNKDQKVTADAQAKPKAAPAAAPKAPSATA